MGAFRLDAALEQRGITVSPRTYERILALHRELYGLPGPVREPPGVPEGIVRDGGSIFCAKDAQRICDALGIENRQIDSAQAWENYIETAFTVQRRMANYHFAPATTWVELEAVHARYFHDYNHQPRFAHHYRPAGRRSPARVLGLAQGGWCDSSELNRR